jgi:hypothetical protein
MAAASGAFWRRRPARRRENADRYCDRSEALIGLFRLANGGIFCKYGYGSRHDVTLDLFGKHA